MGSIVFGQRLSIQVFFLYAYVIAATFFSLTDARFFLESFRSNGHNPELGRSSMDKMWERSEVLIHVDVKAPLEPINADAYDISSSFSLPSIDSLAPLPSFPENVSPSCVSSPLVHLSPSTSLLSPTTPNNANALPLPPPTFTPNLPMQSPTPSPPNAPSSKPPQNPPTTFPRPPSPSPPIVHPPPSAPPPPRKRPQFAIWCVAKPTVPDLVMQEALDYACGSGADCKSIQPNGPCFLPNTLFAHASYAFNSYWQKSKAGGGTCDFGGTAMLVTVDPSFNDCNFISN